MILSVITLLMVGIIAYFHFVQGFFSATISAIIAVLSAVLAIGYQESIVDNLLKGKMGDDANAVIIVLVFLASYVILRIIFDKAVPGNVRVPATLDKVGAAAMGIVAGCFAAGVFAIAVQTLPFGPAVGGYSPFDLTGTQKVIVPGSQQMVDSIVNDQLKTPTMDRAKEGSLWIPVDNLVLYTVNNLSADGTMAGEVPLSAIHPDYPEELFGSRLGIQVGANHTALNVPGEEQVKLDTLFSVAALPAADGELKELRNGNPAKPADVRPTASQVLLIARLTVSHDAADDADKIFRFSTGSIHLVANGKDYFPIGVMDMNQGAPLLLLQWPDDFLFVDMSAGDAPIDLAFLVEREDLFGSAKSDGQKVADGRFISVKRLARVDLSGAPVDNGYNPQPSKVMHKTVLMDQIRKAPPPAVTVAPATPPDVAVPTSTPQHRRTARAPYAPPADSAAPAADTSSTPTADTASPASPAADSTASPGNASLSAQIPYKIGVTTSDENAANLGVAGGTVSLKDSRLASVSISPAETLDKLSQGDSQLSELYVPDGKKLVQVTGSPTSSVPQLTDASGTAYPANGYAALVDGKLMMRFDYDRAASAVNVPPGATATTYLFVVPSGTHLVSFSAGGTQSPANLNVP